MNYKNIVEGKCSLKQIFLSFNKIASLNGELLSSIFNLWL